MNTQEYFGWIGNSIFISAELAQVAHSIKTRKTIDISYIMVVLMLLGNGAYTAFGVIDNSLSLSVGSGISFLVLLFQLWLKIYYERILKINSENDPLLPKSINDSGNT